MELTWSILTLTLTWCNGCMPFTNTLFLAYLSINQIFLLSDSMLAAMRFFIGLAESTFYPAIQYVIGSWYKNEELAKRACIFHVSFSLRHTVDTTLIYGLVDGLGFWPYRFR